jgi:large subunit ribosomal protein L35
LLDSSTRLIPGDVEPGLTSAWTQPLTPAPRRGLKRNESNMPKLKTHKGIKKRFKVSANGKVSHKRCGSSHLNSHKSGKQVRRLRKKSIMKVTVDAKRLRRAVHQREGTNPAANEAARQIALAEDAAAEAVAPAPAPGPGPEAAPQG